jgi:hypothetical protein
MWGYVLPAIFSPDVETYLIISASRMIAFLVAFCFICFQDTTPAARGVVGSACILTGVLVSWCILVGWDKRIHLQPKATEPTIVNPDDGDSSEDENEKYDTVEQVYNVSGRIDNGATEPHSQANSLTQDHREAQNPGSGDGSGQGRISNLSDKLKKPWFSLLNLDLRSKLPKSLRSPDSEVTTVAV